ncbi:3-dehydroquinate synthase [Paenarthrobacter nicotinovorans]|uniref:sedoheptulose 7-phosphate cyclase n=1 Tax=Paenarthrobacter nicotinovorans TaxID=29320 RepID=UPI002788B204|nr:sedoheptulose 7-phosphate cyclase [Paenarthrobacter nicotinovorans]MDP9936280.1 3-dehydroquinate synthase [Paenarthrobacter nicotinovorans]
MTTINRAWTVSAQQDVQYRVETTFDILDPANPTLVDGEHGSRRLIVTDTTVNDLYGEKIRAYAAANLSEYRILVLPHGETNKRWSAVETVLEAIETFKLDRRREPVIAIGGGVLTDIVGFACSIYRRNTPFVRVPTTLIGIVDASVGVKTGVNFHAGKNKIGTYFAASRNLLDTSFLSSLDQRHVSNGLAEILKIALVKDEELFNLLEEHGTEALNGRFQQNTEAQQQIIDKAITGMLEELEPNLWEQTLERLVDYGHTFSPTVEMTALPELLHGEAVCLDMALTTAISVHRGLVAPEQSSRIFSVMRALGLPVNHPSMSVEVLVTALIDTTRHRNGLQRLPLPTGIGSATFVNDLTSGDIEAALEILALAMTRDLAGSAA